MFEIDEDFLVSVGYDLALLSDDQIGQYKREMTEELTARLSERLGGELSEEQTEEFEQIQDSPERARRWLDEFHTDYRDKEEYKELRKVTDDEDEATRFYAASFWMSDAVPKYGQLIQEEMDKYQAELVEKRRLSNEALSELI